MPLEHILRAMQAQAESEIQNITHAAESEAAQLIAEAETEAKAIRARHRGRVEPMLVAEAASLQNKANLGALRAKANGREQLLVEAFTRAHDCLAEIRQTQQYAAIFGLLAAEATAGLGDDLIARVDPGDVQIASATFARLGVKAEVQELDLPLGGLEVMTRDHRVIVVNTIASRLDRARGILRGPIAAILANSVKPEEEWKTTTPMSTPA